MYAKVSINIINAEERKSLIARVTTNAKALKVSMVIFGFSKGKMPFANGIIDPIATTTKRATLNSKK
jgi:hypothetical protein